MHETFFLPQLRLMFICTRSPSLSVVWVSTLHVCLSLSLSFHLCGHLASLKVCTLFPHLLIFVRVVFSYLPLICLASHLSLLSYAALFFLGTSEIVVVVVALYVISTCCFVTVSKIFFAMRVRIPLRPHAKKLKNSSIAIFDQSINT